MDIASSELIASLSFLAVVASSDCCSIMTMVCDAACYWILNEWVKQGMQIEIFGMSVFAKILGIASACLIFVSGRGYFFKLMFCDQEGM